MTEPGEAGLNAAYRERNALVAGLIRLGGFKAEVVMAPDTEGWWIVYVETPAGQLSWHIGPDDMDLFSEWPVAFGTRKSPWDGHTTEQKYERLAALRAPKWRLYINGIEAPVADAGLDVLTANVVRAAEAYIDAFDEPGPREGFDSNDDYYASGVTSDEWQDRLRAAITARRDARLAAEPDASFDDPVLEADPAPTWKGGLLGTDRPLTTIPEA